MTIPRRTDTATGENSALRRVKLLTELPHVGAAPGATPAQGVFETEPTPRSSGKPSARAVKSMHPAFAELPELPEEAPAQYGRRETRFVDRAHVDHEWESSAGQNDDDFELRERVSSSRKPIVQRHSQTQLTRHQTGWRPFLSQAHTQVAPFAGLIVTTALMASAALLFWMMLGGRQPGAEFNDFALPGEGFRVEVSEPDFSTEESLTAPLAEADIKPTGVQPENSEYVQPTTPAQPSPLEIQPHSVPMDTSAATLQPIIEQIGAAPAPLGQLFFPVTNMPLALDYSKAVSNIASKAVNNSAATLRELPAVAERADAATTEPINR